MHLIAIDWGTVSLRGALLDAQGGGARGTRHRARHPTVPPGGFAAVFEELFGDWMRARRHALPDLRHGRQQAGLGRGAVLPLPGRPDEIAARSSPWIEPRPHRDRARPELRARRRARRDARRGGAGLRRAATARRWPTACSCCPARTASGSRSSDGRVERFSHLHDRRVLRAAAPALDPRAHACRPTTAPLDEAAFAARRRRSAATAGGLLHSAFSARTLSLFERMPAGELASYLSGLVIGEELRSQSARTPATLVADRRAGADRSAIELALRAARRRARARSAPRPPGAACCAAAIAANRLEQS